MRTGTADSTRQEEAITHPLRAAKKPVSKKMIKRRQASELIIYKFTFDPTTTNSSN
jgi:hypothetical protein